MAAAEPWSAADRRWMELAFELAERGLYGCDPNPRVGCVLVRDEQLIAEGFHLEAGGAHAERMALDQAGKSARGATCYVTLEPCSHQGRTGPCANALIEAGIARVVAASRDPNPEVAGSGLDRLRKAGIDVSVGLLDSFNAALNPGFIARMLRGVPWVRVKLAASIDGRTALANGDSQWITGAQARADVQHWRARAGAVLSGIGTVIADDPRLNVRPPWDADGETGAWPALKQPLRVIMDSEYRTPPKAQLFSEPGPVWICGDENIQAAQELSDRARIVGVAREREGGPLAIAPLLAELAAEGVNEVHVEAGPRLAGAFIAGNLADELLLYLAPTVLGDKARPLFDIPKLTELNQRLDFEIKEIQTIGRDLRLRMLRQNTLAAAS